MAGGVITMSPPEPGTAATPTVDVRVTPATPGIWSVSHQNLDSFARISANIGIGIGSVVSAEEQKDQGGRSVGHAVQNFPATLVTDVTFCWTQKASSAFVTGTFNSWEVTIPLTLATTTEGNEVWIAVKSLPPGEYQYKFIIDNVWRHAPDQPVTYDERGIINNTLLVQLESCGDSTCFCASLQEQIDQQKREPSQRYSGDNSNDKDDRTGGTGPDGSNGASASSFHGFMTPGTTKNFQKTTGVATKYVERCSPQRQNFQKAYMHNPISDRPFDVTVVSVSKLAEMQLKPNEPEEPGMISRVSSVEDFRERAMRFDPALQLYQDAAYAAALRNQGNDESMPRTAPSRAASLRDPVELAFSVRSRLSTPRLGFNPDECHEGIMLTDSNHCAFRTQERGLYKSVRAMLPALPGRRTYFEMFAIQPAAGGGLCFGLSTRELPLSCLCGTRPNSIGISSSGNLIRTIDGKESWATFGDGLMDQLKNFCIGVLVEIRTPEESKAQDNITNDSFEVGEAQHEGDHGEAEVASSGDREANAGEHDPTAENPGRHVKQEHQEQQQVQEESPESLTQNGEGHMAEGSGRETDGSSRSPSASWSHLHAKIGIFIDGQKVSDVEYTFVGCLEVFPTISLFARKARVFSMFGSAEMMYQTSLAAQSEPVYDLEGVQIAADDAASGRQWKASLDTLEGIGVAQIPPLSCVPPLNEACHSQERRSARSARYRPSVGQVQAQR
ncbi:5'-AMP-activated protein kinase subunit beta-2 [Porphyridium purpureum]|uniref:5'-AMP-activated protein kinase subunit beta-2 n=1 Tax=Porphyridium purpureum TaxID=35688 RepID=A0A5J4YT32_PORPP|nr:5'-AMP-activated protein kinase subunit beta-2 [Porphyridium purpureum]|eukprot:POR8520..scf227_4